METKELIEEIQVAVSLKDHLDRYTKTEGNTVVSNHQRFVEVTKDREGNLRIVPGIAWPNDSGRAALDYEGMKIIPSSAESDNYDEAIVDHFADYLLSWQEDFDFPREILDDIYERVEVEFPEAEIEETEIFADEDGSAKGIEVGGFGVSIDFQDFEGAGFYFISTYYREDGEPAPYFDQNFQDSLEGNELADDQRKSDLAAKYANWLIGEIRAATE